MNVPVFCFSAAEEVENKTVCVMDLSPDDANIFFCFFLLFFFVVAEKLPLNASILMYSIRTFRKWSRGLCELGSAAHWQVWM